MEKIIGNNAKYEKLEWVTTVYGDDVIQKSTDEMQNLMTNYPDLEVVCCPTTIGILAAAKVVANDADCTIKVAGLGLPSEMKDFVGEGKACPYIYLWNYPLLGETAAYALLAFIDSATTGAVGEEFTAFDGNSYTVMSSSTLDGAQSSLIAIPPLRFTEDNIEEWSRIY